MCIQTVSIINKYLNKQQIWKACKQSYYWDQDTKPRLYIINVVPCLQTRNNPRTSSRIRKKSFQRAKTIQALKVKFYTRNKHWMLGRRAAVNDCWGVSLSSGLNMWSALCPHLRRPGKGAGLWEGEKNVNSDWVMVSLKILMKQLRGYEKAGNWTCHLTLGREAWVWEIKSIM